MELNIFTNCTNSAPSTDLILRTYNSFVNTFGEIPVRVWCDPNPNKDKYPAYEANLKKYFKSVIKVSSLSDGYIKSIKRSNSEYIFMLEHDWTFNKNYISHSLLDIAELMRREKLYHLRFNKRSNIVAAWDKWIKEYNYKGFSYCTTNNMSNNPHIIECKKYREEILNYIRVQEGSSGIEDILLNTERYIGAIYGKQGYPATISHIDGRNYAKKE